jgi:hypothetical protein
MLNSYLAPARLAPLRFRAPPPEPEPGPPPRRPMSLAIVALVLGVTLALVRLNAGCMTQDSCEDHCMHGQDKPWTTEKFTACSDQCAKELSEEQPPAADGEGGGGGTPQPGAR